MKLDHATCEIAQRSCGHSISARPMLSERGCGQSPSRRLMPTKMVFMSRNHSVLVSMSEGKGALGLSERLLVCEAAATCPADTVAARTPMSRLRWNETGDRI